MILSVPLIQSTNFLKKFETVAAGQERLGDGIMFRMRGEPLHVGMVLALGTMLHVEDGSDTCIEKYDNFRWEKRIVGFYRHEAAHG